jgi:hypothetical protein
VRRFIAMDTETVAFSISRREIDRRIRAFTTLGFSFLGSFLIAGPLLNPQATIDGLLWFIGFSGCVTVAIVVSRRMTIKFFERILKTKIIVNNIQVERVTAKDQEICRLDKITRVHTVITAKKHIREIQIYYEGGKKMFIDGLNDFEIFKNRVIKTLPKKTIMTTAAEPIDYDHPTFYLGLGILAGLGIAGSVKMLSETSKLIFPIVSLYTLGLAGYFLVKKPLANRYGYMTVRSDYIWAGALATAAISMGLLGL